jgi:hypothetical protein
MRVQQKTRSGRSARRRPQWDEERVDPLTGFAADGATPLTTGRVLALQRTAGNAAVSRLLATQRLPVQRAGGTTYKRKFSSTTLTDILNASEGRAGSTGAAGHPRSQHVGSREQTLAVAKAEGKKKTLYRSPTTQDQAAAGALNSPSGQSELARLDADPTLNRVIVKAAPTHPVQVWVATPTSVEAEKATASNTTIIVDRLPGLAAPEIHVQTCYPVS